MAPEPEVAPAPPPAPRPIYVIKRKKGGHAGHHGGAWKVAYADFVTAMMALFIVLWLMSADEEVKKAISAFFNDPTGQGKDIGTAVAGAGHAIEVPKEDMAKLREKIEQALKTMPNFRDLKDHVEITVTADGLRIELLETEAGMFFESGRALPTAKGAELLTMLAHELAKMPNHLLIEGHTDAKPFGGDGTYTNWELSSDRGNAARRLIEANGVRREQVGQVRGFADRQLRHPENPLHASNRRVSVIVQYLTAPAAPPEAKKAEGTKPEAKEGAAAVPAPAPDHKPPAHAPVQDKKAADPKTPPPAPAQDPKTPPPAPAQEKKASAFAPAQEKKKP